MASNKNYLKWLLYCKLFFFYIATFKNILQFKMMSTFHVLTLVNLYLVPKIA